VLILPLFYKVERLEDQSLSERFSRLADGTDLNVEGVYRMEMSDETVKANAMLAGLGRTRRVILGDTLLNNFSPQELDVIFAHELGHHVFRHLPKLLVLGLAYSTLGFYLCDLGLRWWVRDVNYQTLPVWALPFLLFVLTVFSLLLGPLLNALSRRFERQCDRYALERTGDRPAYCSAFNKLAKQNKADPDPPAWEVVLFHDHPPIGERLKMAE
jgi:STE24 endopeptidase